MFDMSGEIVGAHFMHLGLMCFFDGLHCFKRPFVPVANLGGRGVGTFTFHHVSHHICINVQTQGKGLYCIHDINVLFIVLTKYML
jgi:hypothetical protein